MSLLALPPPLEESLPPLPPPLEELPEELDDDDPLALVIVA